MIGRKPIPFGQLFPLIIYRIRNFHLCFYNSIETTKSVFYSVLNYEIAEFIHHKIACCVPGLEAFQLLQLFAEDHNTQICPKSKNSERTIETWLQV